MTWRETARVVAYLRRYGALMDRAEDDPQFRVGGSIQDALTEARDARSLATTMLREAGA